MLEGILNIDRDIIDNIEEFKKKKKEIKVGYYIIFDEEHGISKVIEKDESGFLTSKGDYIPYTSAQQIIKYSKNIYDLLDDGDLVELEYYDMNYSNKRITEIFVVIYYGDYTLILRNGSLRNKKIGFEYDLQTHKFKPDKYKLNEYKPKLKSVLKNDEYHRNCFKED